MKIVLASIAILFSASAFAADGPVTVWFQEQGPAVSDRLALLCADFGGEVTDQDDRHVLCRKPMTGGKGILAQALLGNRYSTSPDMMVRFTILKDGSATRVQASQWIEIQMAGGQTRRNDLNGQKQRSDLENALIGVGAHNAPPELLPDTPGK